MVRQSLSVLMFLSAVALHAQTPSSPHDMSSWGLVLESPAMKDVTVTPGRFATTGDAHLSFDLYRPAKATQPVPIVLLLSLGRDARTYRRPHYADWGRLLAAHGLAAVTMQSRWERHGEDIPSVVAHLRRTAKEHGIAADHLGAFAVSGVVGAAYATIVDPALRVGCFALYYGAPHSHVPAGETDLLLVRAGRDNPGLNRRLDDLLAKSLAEGVGVDLVSLPNAHHAFDVLDDEPASRRAIRRTVAWFREKLLADREAPTPAPARRALAHYSYGEWKDAAAAYAVYTKATPDDAVGWYRLGACHLRLENFAEALPALERSAKAGYRADVCYYNVGCLHALAGRRTEALDALERAVRAGFRDRRTMIDDEDLAGLRDDKRFRALVERLR